MTFQTKLIDWTAGSIIDPQIKLYHTVGTLGEVKDQVQHQRMLTNMLTAELAPQHGNQHGN